MESCWTSKCAILRDLSVAQGREVPVELKNAVSKDEKPPALNFTEDTEEEFFENCVSNGDFAAGPDITLIQNMLDLVREFNVKDVNENEDKTVLEISKINHQGSGDTPQLEEAATKCVKNETKTKRKRNVAIASIMQAYADNSQNDSNSNAPARLLKPNDIIDQSNDIVKGVPKPPNTEKEKSIQAVISPTFMFKKKSPNQKTAEKSQKQSFPITSKSTSPPEYTKPGSFVPSSHAGVYYKKYIERSEMQENMKLDLWAKAEKQMKEIEAKRKHENVLSSSSSVQESEEVEELHGMDCIKLPHALPEGGK